MTGTPHDHSCRFRVVPVCHAVASPAREHGPAAEDVDGNLLPSVLDAVTRTASEAIWLGLTQGIFDDNQQGVPLPVAAAVPRSRDHVPHGGCCCEPVEARGRDGDREPGRDGDAGLPIRPQAHSSAGAGITLARGGGPVRLELGPGQMQRAL